MRILQVFPGSYVSGRGGLSEHVMRISESLTKLGHDVTVFATNSGELPNFEVINGVKVRRFSRFSPSHSYYFSLEMIRALLSADFDVVHGHSFQALPMHFAFLAKCKRFVVTTHFHGSGHSVFRNCLFRLFHFFGEHTLKKADVVVSVSEYEKKLLLGQFDLNEHEVVVVPNGLCFEDFRGLKRVKSDFRKILFVGRLEKYKGVQYVLEVLPNLPTDIVLEIVGRGPFRAALENRAKELGVSNRVLFFQDLSRKALLQKYVDSEMLVLLSTHEAYGLVVAEALAAGTPCVVTDTSALSEWINDRNCFGVEYPVDLELLTNLINKIIEDKPVQKPLKVNNKIISWMAVARQLEQVYGC